MKNNVMLALVAFGIVAIGETSMAAKIERVNKKQVKIEGVLYYHDNSGLRKVLRGGGVGDPPPQHIYCNPSVISFLNVRPCSSWGQSCGLCKSNSVL
jgi:hypothetical protein